MDIKINAKEGYFKLRACGVVIEDGKLLTVDNKNGIYFFPGGHVEIGETGKEAAKREMSEELGREIELGKLVCLSENLFEWENLPANEIAFYYYVTPKKPLPKEDFVLHEIDKGVPKTQHYHWVDLKDEKELSKIRPVDVVKAILQGATDKIVYTNGIKHQ